MSHFVKQKSLHGLKSYVDTEDRTVAKNAFAAGGENDPTVVLPGSHDTVAVFDDFLGDLIGDEWAVVSADTGSDNTGTIVTSTNGVCRLASPENQTPTQASVIALSTGAFKNWKADQGKGPPSTHGSLRMGVRLKFDSVSRTTERQHVFVGFSDSGGAEMPLYDTGAGVISNAADYCGFMFSPGGDTGWSLVAGDSTAGDSGDQLVATGANPTANAYEDLEIEISHGGSDTGGTAYFYRNGQRVGSITSPVNSVAALAPWVGFFPQDTDAVNLDIDYINIAAPRDTGT